MRTRVPKYFNEFECISSECTDTCCAGWEIVVDDDTFEHYQKVEGEFGDVLRNQITLDDGDNIFVLKNHNCPFLNENGLCDIYSNIGEDSLCYTCKQYPRFTEEFGNLREIGLSLSCPEAARIILKDSKKIEFELSEDDDMVTSYNDINAELFMNLIMCRNMIMEVLQDREINLEVRTALILNFAQEIQHFIDSNKIHEIASIRKKYEDVKFKNDFIRKMSSCKYDGNKRYEKIKEYINVYKNLEHINDDDPLSLNNIYREFYKDRDVKHYVDKHNEFNDYYEKKMYKFEHALVYFIFRYFMKAVFDYDVSAKVKFAIVSFIMIKESCVVRWIENEYKLSDEDIIDIMHMYSKDIEHLEENVESLSEMFETNEIFSARNIIV